MREVMDWRYLFKLFKSMTKVWGLLWSTGRGASHHLWALNAHSGAVTQARRSISPS
jgi:hypothetical protein